MGCGGEQAAPQSVITDSQRSAWSATHSSQTSETGARLDMQLVSHSSRAFGSDVRHWHNVAHVA